MIIVLCLCRWNARGFGFFGCGFGVTFSIFTNSNFIFSNVLNVFVFLLNFVVRLIGFENVVLSVFMCSVFLFCCFCFGFSFSASVVIATSCVVFALSVCSVGVVVLYVVNFVFFV